ncbi:D-alanyl-D-alanine carboxypeptidase/D-alanyl-D-alanine-endopeptidase [Gramella sp. GC03-9]|uniref:D-alanyl-D-alanine carboxypeptidase/D-alanyl-D-alanine-endopeptidase n=1 Tax=Christiangramia oceanisediminis TaxID=2920386 RepID=A0A9X2RAL1_9FLAO|nr:D-alanyl-D-alanine carboxypeptidase/D-alanyl-D-alanine-endopeptidase [Gramella oceanisediminis]MCP9201458.1 D-alanyl-D-alanine carboxypeptidase/D-alanyl-D-alanine-endopeptidase [Gramella oceanisediminis]
MHQNFKHFKRKFSGLYLLLLFLVVATSCSSVKRTNKEIKKNLNTTRVFENGFTGLAVYDPVKNEMVYAYNADKYFTPASNTKLFTFYAGLKMLGDSIPALKYAKREDSLIFKATGDPSLLNPNLPESRVIDFLSKAEENLYYIAPVFTEKYFGPGWSWDDYNYSYSSERTPMPIYGNNITFDFDENSDFEVMPTVFKDSVTISANGNEASLKRAMTSNKFKMNKGYTSRSREIPLKYSDLTFTRLLEDTLKKDITIIEKYSTNKEFKTLYSIPADSVYKKMLEDSDNFIAEQILLMASGTISDSLKTEITIDYMKENHLKDLPDEPVWRDGSGLSRYNLFTPRSMVKLLEKILAERSHEDLFSLMATGGESGTLKNYYKADEPYIFAKTGTLSNNHSLSGYLKTQSGKILIFSFMNSNYTIPTSELKAGMEKILENIRDNY